MRFLLIVALIAYFAWATGRAVDYELATAGPPPVQLEQPGYRYQGLTARAWARRAVRARKDANARGRTIRRLQREIRMQHPSATGHWLDGAFLCIHRYERGAAGWQTDTGNGYRGGLQMDAAFSYTYGPAWAKQQWGTNPAHWPAAVQMAAAMHAWTSRGFGPWPTTRRYCGL